MRRAYELTHSELHQFNRLRPIQGEALLFWAKVAAARNLDPKSIISNGLKFTALVVGSGKDWCWPLALKCAKKPSYKEA